MFQAIVLHIVDPPEDLPPIAPVQWVLRKRSPFCNETIRPCPVLPSSSVHSSFMLSRSPSDACVFLSLLTNKNWWQWFREPVPFFGVDAPLDFRRPKRAKLHCNRGVRAAAARHLPGRCGDSGERIRRAIYGP